VSDQWAYARKETVDAIERLGRELVRAGITVQKLQLPAELEQIVQAQGRISAYEARYSLANERLNHHASLSKRLQARLDMEGATTPQEYLELRLRAQLARHRARSLFEDVDVLLYPASEGEAEVGLEETGSPRFGSLSSILHLPAVAFPSSAGPSGMPLGVQVLGPYGKDQSVLLAAQLIARHADYRRDA
jgi:amidase